LGLPVTLTLLLRNLPADATAISPTSWLSFVYLGLMSQWVGFFFWYRGLLLGGIAKVSQVQLTQLFITLGFSALLLGEAIEPAMLLVAAATVALIVVGRRRNSKPCPSVVRTRG
jgi:drug/metabolite transporter (DMT)-like permease